MRPKFVFAMLLLALLVLGGAYLLKQHLGNNPAPAPEIATPAPAPAANVAVSVAPPPAPVAAAPVVTNTPTAEERQAAIDAEMDRLQQWSMNDDPASLSNILADLTNPEQEIREAAIEAAKQFDNTNAIPALKAAAANTTDTDEQIALLEAANFLSLPSMDFTMPTAGPPPTPEQIQMNQQNKAAMDARRQARTHGNAPNPGAQSPPGQN